MFNPLANVEKDDGKSKRKKNYSDKNNAKVAEIGHAEEEDEEGEEEKDGGGDSSNERSSLTV